MQDFCWGRELITKGFDCYKLKMENVSSLESFSGDAPRQMLSPSYEEEKKFSSKLSS